MAEKKKKKTPSFVLTLELDGKVKAASVTEPRLEIGRQVRNTCLGELQKRHRSMTRTNRHQKLMRQLSAVSKKLSSEKKKSEKKRLQGEKDALMQEVFEMQSAYGITEYDMHDYAKSVKHHFNDKLDVNAAQKAASEAWKSFKKFLKHEAKKVRFKKFGEMESVEGKDNRSGFVWRDGFLVIGDIRIKALIDRKDAYAVEALKCRVKYCRLVRKAVRGKKRYYVQLVLEGTPPKKIDPKTGLFKRKLGKGSVGGDIGTRSAAFVGENNVLLAEFSPKTNALDKEVRNLQRKMERSRRANNPNNYNADRTIKKGKKTWAKSKRYKKLQAKRREIHRKSAAKRKDSHNVETNRLLGFGDTFFVEKNPVKAWQKRAKETKVNEKTGKMQSKKRFGESVLNKAPGAFYAVLKQKVEAEGGTFVEVNAQTFKASQYDHTIGKCAKKKLSQRMHVFEDGRKIQRDLYSAFLMQNSNKNGKTPNRKKCLAAFESFCELHEKEIARIKEAGLKIPNSGL